MRLTTRSQPCSIVYCTASIYCGAHIPQNSESDLQRDQHRSPDWARQNSNTASPTQGLSFQTPRPKPPYQPRRESAFEMYICPQKITRVMLSLTCMHCAKFYILQSVQQCGICHTELRYVPGAIAGGLASPQGQLTSWGSERRLSCSSPMLKVKIKGLAILLIDSHTHRSRP
jgi:hypothetical protein